MPTTVRVPEPFTGLFDQAETYVRNHFDKLVRAPEKGTIRVGDERYVLIRAASLTTGFLEVMRDLIGEEEALKFWYRMARVIGREDSRAFCAARNLTDGPARLSTGPVHFAFTGWARVEIDDRSRPSSDDSYYLEYTHPNTFESESWARSGKVAPRPVCVFSAGYSAGWCSEAFNLEVHAREVRCTAAGEGECRFVMSPWDRLEGYVADVRARPAVG
jgi:predicted hydrocarbon binding protein